MENQDIEIKEKQPLPLNGPAITEASMPSGGPSEVAGEPQQAPIQEAPEEDKRSTLREYLESIIITAIIALFITTFVVQAFKIPTGSMENNLLIGDHLLVNKFIFGIHPRFLSSILPYREVKRGDVLVFKYPNDPEVDFVKRVIGLPGDHVEMVRTQILINGVPLKESYVRYEPTISHRATYPAWDVPAGHYFVLGDNRDNSRDSREWGFVPRDHVIGKAFLIYWSFVTDREEYQRTDISDRAEQMKDVFRNFFTKTRWERTFKVIR